MAPSSERSLHPTDVLIRDLLQSGRDATGEEVSSITQRIGTAPFPAVTEHLARRLLERQWHPATTEEDYLEDVRQACRDERARLAIYIRRGGNLAAILADRKRIIPADRGGEKALPLFFVA